MYYLWVAVQALGYSSAACKLVLNLVQLLNLLSQPETFGNWTDGCISCRHSRQHHFIFTYLLTRVHDVWILYNNTLFKITIFLLTEKMHVFTRANLKKWLILKQW